jgi:hypothetical protein
MEKQCILCSRCELFKGDISLSEDVKIMYKYHYCLSDSQRWRECKRFTFDNINGFCPDFVMPNSLLSLDQIWQKTQREYTLQY